MSTTQTIETLPTPARAERGAAIRAVESTVHVFLTHVLPPLVIIGFLVLVWQVLGSRPGASLPAPTKVVQDTWELITQPFYDRGGNDVGIAWRCWPASSAWPTATRWRCWWA
ncbi:hypothetical protein [Ramlibacter montanisoli]|uniref:hypothetical protein n=1 Tax=Ramlibacter montanisoli TaxID=2732512 RepID=UPI00209C2119|nr:hypothetical protein [Ramlibacter montanisoli]